MPRDVGGWAKKNTHQVFGLERLHKVSCVAGAGGGSQTHVCNKRQVNKSQELYVLEREHRRAQFLFFLYNDYLEEKPFFI